MDAAKMKVVELRKELNDRGLDSSGLKAVLVERLSEALATPPTDQEVVIKSQRGRAKHSRDDEAEDEASESENVSEKPTKVAKTQSSYLRTSLRGQQKGRVYLENSKTMVCKRFVVNGEGVQFSSGTIGGELDFDIEIFSSEDEAVADFLKRINETEKEGFEVTEEEDYPPSDASEPESEDEDGDGKDEEEEDEDDDSSDDPDEDEDTRFEKAHNRKIENLKEKFGDKWRDEWAKEYA
jgi:hypothetical protein